MYDPELEEDEKERKKKEEEEDDLAMIAVIVGEEMHGDHGRGHGSCCLLVLALFLGIPAFIYLLAR